MIHPIQFNCCLCRKPSQAQSGTALQMLQLCPDCAAKRVAAGLEARRKFDADARQKAGN